MSNAIKDVCGARKRHVEAYAAIQKSYKALAKQIGDDNRLDTAAAVASFEAMVKACIDHKSNVTTGGHNIMIDVIPNDIAARVPGYGQGNARRGDELADDRSGEARAISRPERCCVRQ